MPVELNDVEARILGSLVEKSLTTPDQYPLTLNALVNACNQKTSREPVMNLDDAAVCRGLAALLEKGLVQRRHVPGSRVPKLEHCIGKLLNGENVKEVAAICLLLLRGPQTAGEIKTRSERLCDFSGTAEVEALLLDLSSREGGALAARLERQAGQKEARYRHLFSESRPDAAAAPAASAASDPLTQLEKRVAALEARVVTLEGRSRAQTPVQG